MISKELLYTALTRQSDKIIILYSGNPNNLLNYANINYSAVAKRHTDLFCFNHEENIYYKLIKVGNDFYDERLIHHTLRGELVRSKSEVIIANALYYHNIDYVYEPKLIINNIVKRPDFMIIDHDLGKKWYWEHLGLMQDDDYRKDWNEKKQFYLENGIITGKNLIVTHDDQINGIDSTIIDEIIKKNFL